MTLSSWLVSQRALCERDFKDAKYEDAAHALPLALQVIEKLLCFANIIAAWSDGPEVTGSFDDPASAALSRSTLTEIDALLLGNQKHEGDG